MTQKSRQAAAAFSTITPGQVVTQPNVYSVALPSSSTYIQHIGAINRTSIKFDSGNTFLGTTPIAITFTFRRIGTPQRSVVEFEKRQTIPSY